MGCDGGGGEGGERELIIKQETIRKCSHCVILAMIMQKSCGRGEGGKSYLSVTNICDFILSK